MKRLLLTSLAVCTFLPGASILAQEKVADLPRTELQVVGGLSNVNMYMNFEKPFWTETVPELSGGKITATVKGYNEMGLKGPEVMRLVGQGVIPIGTATLAYFASDNAINEAIDLAGLAPTAKIAREVTEVFTPVYEKFYKGNNIKILAFSTSPAQVLFCNTGFTGLADIKGKKIRTSSRTQGEFVQALGGTSVTLPFGDVVPALQNGVVDCAITGSMSGFTAKWHEVSTHLYALPINWNQQVYAANLPFWNGLDPKVQDFLQKNLVIMANRIWDDAAKETQRGYDCNTGAAACDLPAKGKMKLVEPTEADRELLKKITAETIVPKWAARCSAECVKDFNATIGKLLNITASK